MEYKFKKANEYDESKIIGTSKICDIYDFMENIDSFQDKQVLAFGQLKKAFGEPIYISENIEQQYEYQIIAEDENGKEIYFSVYSGPSGASIGGESSNQEAAMKLAEFIRLQDIVDYEYQGYYMDGPAVIKMGIRDGVSYYEEQELELSEEEFIDLYNRLYGL